MLRAGFRWWGPGTQRLVGGPMCGCRIFRYGGRLMKSLVFPRIINIYDVISWRHISNKTFLIQLDIWQWLAICETIAKPVTRSIASSFFQFFLKKVLKIFWKKFLGDPTISSSLNASPRSAINFTTETNVAGRADSRYCSHWQTWLASSVSILHSD